MLNPEVLDLIPSSRFRTLLEWAEENLLRDRIYQVENWLELGFHLCKQRWDGSMDWLEQQPVSKILTMVNIVQKHVDAQEAEMKKASRRKR